MRAAASESCLQTERVERLNKMATEITDEQQSPSTHEDNGNGAGLAADPNRGVKRPRASAAADDDDDDDDKPGRERRKIEIKFIQDKSRRHITFSKRKAGIMKKVGDAQLRARETFGRNALKLPITTKRVAVTDLPASMHRHMNCPSSLAPKCYFSSSRRPAWSTHSPHQNSSLS